MTIRVFLDTEFTSLDQSASLISIGLITEDASRSFYAELLNTYLQEKCSAFVLQEVLPLLDAPLLVEPINYKNVYARMTLAETCLHLNYWVAALIDPVQIWTDAPNHDWRYIQQIFSTTGLPYNLLTTPNAILGEDISANARYQNTVEREYSQNSLKRHHALDDAKAIRLGWQAINSYK